MEDVNASQSAEEQPERVGFEIGGRFYPIDQAEKLGDPAIIYETTGLNWDTYQAGLGVPDPESEEELEPVDDALIMTGLIALAVAHGNPNWPRHKIVRFITQLDGDKVEMIGMDEAPQADGVPPTTEPPPSPELEPATTASGDQTPDATPEPSLELQD